MPRKAKQSGAPAPSKEAQAPKADKARTRKAAAPAEVDARPLPRRRAMVAAVLGVVFVVTLSGRLIWQLVAPTIASNPRYLVREEQISISDLPEWIDGDVRRQVVQNSGIAGRLSMLDPNFMATVKNSFALHPWVESITRIEKRPPAGLHVELVYRRPVAVIEAPEEQGAKLLPIDAHGIHLPADDVPMIRRSYLPRIIGIVGQPPLGQPWDDARVAGAVDLAVSLAAEWESLNLWSIVPSARVKVLDDRNYFDYELVNRGGTRIEWGAPPHASISGEAPFEAKLTLLKQCIAKYAGLDWLDWPERIDLRRGGEATPRTAKKPPNSGSEPVVAKKTDDAETDEDPVLK